MGKHVVQGLCGLARKYGEFPTGYTMDEATTRFDGQAIGLAHLVRPGPQSRPPFEAICFLVLVKKDDENRSLFVKTGSGQTEAHTAPHTFRTFRRCSAMHITARWTVWTGAETSFSFASLYTNNRIFAKTGSGQT